ncbi:hypothetical protein BU065_07740, partial [Staphylococcus succinus]
HYIEELLDSTHLLSSSKRFELSIDGLRDAFIKDKMIDIMNLINNTEQVMYTFNRDKINVSCSPATFAKLIYQIATHNIDIHGAIYQPRLITKARIS